MAKSADELVSKIIKLVNELGELSGGKTFIPSKIGNKIVKQKQNDYSGTIGGLRMLIDDGFFENPKNFIDIQTKLTEEGRYNSKPSISMGLLNLVKKRTLSRLGKKGVWQYVIRK